MQTILIPTDFSKGAENAARYGRTLARTIGAKVRYLHMVNMPVEDPMVNSSLLADTARELKAIAEEKLQQLVGEDTTQGLTADYHIAFDDLISAINETSEVVMVVIGKTGERNFLDRLIGSTAQNLINEVHAPLLVVPENYSGDILHRICYASKLEFNENTQIAQALDWRKFSNQDLIIGHIIEEFPLDINENAQFRASIDQALGNKGYIYKDFAAEAYKKGIQEFIERENISLLFVTTRKRGFLEGIIEPSQTRRMINTIEIPVVVLNHNVH